MEKTKRNTALAALALLIGWAVLPGYSAGRTEGQFEIQVQGKEVGSERFWIESGVDSISSGSTVEFRNPGPERQKVQLTTSLKMDAQYLPRAYELKSDVDGKKGGIRGSFSPNEAMFEYVGATAYKRGVLVGSRYTVLDTNVFHHFIFLARLFALGDRSKPQKFEVVIPQEADTGFLSVSELAQEAVTVRGKKTFAKRLQVDSGALLISLWVDENNEVQKIAVPSKGIEVLRAR
jgi:hypothetical protein